MDEETTVETTEEVEEEASDLEKEPEISGAQKRINQLYAENKNLTARITELEKKPEGTLTDKQQQELEAKKYLQGLVEETLEQREKSKTEKDKEEIAQFETDVSDFLALNTEVKRADFVKFLKDEADDYGTTSVEGAGKLFLKLNKIDAAATDKAKADIKKKPGLLEHEGGESPKGYDSEKDQGKSLMELANEKIREFGLK